MLPIGGHWRLSLNWTSMMMTNTCSQPAIIRLANGARRRGLTVEQAELIQQAVACLEQQYWVQKVALDSPQASRDYLKLRLDGLPQEIFACLFLDNRHRVLAYEELFQGTLDGASVHPREVVRRVLETNAAGVIFAHNHPSGMTEPSQADIQITQRLKEALALIEVRVLDHLVIGEGEGVSFAERGLL